MKIRTLPLLLLTPLAGCSDSDIDAIKGGRLDIQPQYTVGEAFDNRKVCKETSWEAFEDDRQRSIVEYRCYLNGYDAVYKDKAEAIHKGLEKVESRIANRKQKLTDDLAKVEAALPVAQQAMNDGSDIAKYEQEYDQKIELHRAFLEQLNSHDVDYFIANGLDVPEDLNGLVGNDVQEKLAAARALPEKAKQARAAGNEALARQLEYNFKTSSRGACESSLFNVRRNTQATVERLEQRKATAMESARNALASDVRSLESRIKELKEELIELDSKASDFDELRVQKQAEEEALLATASDAQAYEYYQWTVLDDESFMIVAGGIMEKEPGQEEFSDKPYSRPADTVALVYQDDVTDFKQYKQAIGAKAWLRFLGY